MGNWRLLQLTRSKVTKSHRHMARDCSFWKNFGIPELEVNRVTKKFHQIWPWNFARSEYTYFYTSIVLSWLPENYDVRIASNILDTPCTAGARRRPEYEVWTFLEKSSKKSFKFCSKYCSFTIEVVTLTLFFQNFQNRCFKTSLLSGMCPPLIFLPPPPPRKNHPKSN